MVLGRIVLDVERGKVTFLRLPCVSSSCTWLLVNTSIANILSLGDGYKRQYEMGKIHDLSEAGKIPSCEEWKYEGANNVIYLIITPTSSLRYVSLLSFSSASFSPVMAAWSCHLIGRCLLPWESLGWVTLNYSARGLKKRCPIFLPGVHVLGFLSPCLLCFYPLGQGLESHFLFFQNQAVNILVFAGHIICVTATHFHHCTMKAAIDNTRRNVYV